MIPGSRLAGFVVNAAAWLTVQAAAGYLAHRLPDRLLTAGAWLFRERGFERGGRLYVRVFRVRRWSRLLPEARGLFGGGAAGRRRRPALVRADGARARRRPTDEASLRNALVETSRAEAAHWLALAATPLFALWNPPRGLAYVALYAVGANIPCIVSQRYNRIRLARVLSRRISRR